MAGAVIPPVSPGDENPASDLKTDVIKDVERDDTITGDFVGARDGTDTDEASATASDDADQSR